MRRNQFLSQSLILCLSISMGATSALAAERTGSGSSLGKISITNCMVSLIDDVEVPAQEAGVLVELGVKPGQLVKEGELLGRIDDFQARASRDGARFLRDKAEKQRTNDINVRFSKAAADVARAEYDMAMAANKRVPGAVSKVEVRKLRLETRKAELQIEQATVAQELLLYDVNTESAKLKAATQAVERRRILAPFDGIVFDVKNHKYEWVQPGEQVLRVVGMKRLRVEGILDAKNYGPGDVVNKPVTVTVVLPGNHTATFNGTVVFVSPKIQGDGKFLVWAEVENRQEGGQWLLREGQEPTMTVD